MAQRMSQMPMKSPWPLVAQNMPMSNSSPEDEAALLDQQLQSPDPAANEINQMAMQGQNQPPTSPVQNIQAPQMAPAAPQTSNMQNMANLEAQINAERQRGMAESQKGIGDYQDEINALQGQKLQYDYKPLAALVDNLTGSNTYKAAEAMAPKTPEEKRKQLSDMKLKLHSLKGDLTKEQVSSMKELLDAAKARLSAETADKKLQIMMGSKDRSLDLREGAEARRAVNNDQMLKLYTPRLEGAAKIGELITAAKEGKVVKNSAFLGQINKEVAQLETGSQNPGLGQAEKTELLDKKAQYQAIIDSYLGKPEDAVRPEIINAIEKSISELASSYKKGIDGRMDMLKAGATPAQLDIIQAKHDAIKKTYSKRLNGWDEQEAKQAPNGLTADEQKRLEELRKKVGG